MEQAETRKRNREEARNSLEGYTYRLRDQLSEEGFIKASTEEERTSISSLLSVVSEWMWDSAEKAATKDFRSRKTDLE